MGERGQGYGLLQLESGRISVNSPHPIPTDRAPSWRTVPMTVVAIVVGIVVLIVIATAAKAIATGQQGAAG